MALAKRVVLFLIVNILVVSTVSFILYLFNIQPYMTRYGLNYTSLAIFCLIWGMGGAFISLLLSKIMAKWMMGVQVIDPNTRDPSLAALLQMVHDLAKKAGLPRMPEVGIYQSAEVNAFATGPSRSNALVAVSSGLLHKMRKEEVEGVIGHEITHIANGDMVTMTLLQGVINAFVMFFARVVAFALSQALSRSRNEESSSSGFSPFLYQLTVFFLEMVFMALRDVGNCPVFPIPRIPRRCRRRQTGRSSKMIASLISLKNVQEGGHFQAAEKTQAFQSFKISGGRSSFLKLFATHPPLDERIARLKSRYGHMKLS